VQEVLISPTGSGKTNELKVLALAMRRMSPDAKLIISLLTEYEVWRMSDFLNCHGQDVKECQKQEDFASMVDSHIIITTHEVLSYFGEHDQLEQLKPFFLFVDEIDRLSTAHPLSFYGGNKVLSAFGRGFFGFCADPLTELDKGSEGLGCPDEMQITYMNTGDEFKPEI
jgi:transcription termination factor Rho